MSALLIVPPFPVAAIASSRGTGATNLLTNDPREVWADDRVGTEHATIALNLGQPRTIDTIALIGVRPPVSEAAWTVRGSLLPDTAGDIISNWSPLRVPDVSGYFPATSCALWFGAPVSVQYMGIHVRQPTGDPLTIGRLIIGKAFSPALGKEWGGGRRPIDTGLATPLISGGYGINEGVRKRYLGWTFGDLSRDETDQLDMIALEHGETKPLLVVDDPRPTPGLWLRTLYGKFDRWRQFERRNNAQTRWELGFEEWR